jgi:peptide/nickel transport system substrate-binding protein
VLFDTVSPNNHGALAKTAVRRALEYAINRNDLVEDEGGSMVALPLSHALPSGVLGSQNFDLYPYDPSTAASMLKTALRAGQQLRLRVLYQSTLGFEVSMVQTLQTDLAKSGISVTGVGVSSQDFYNKYLNVPAADKNGSWDLALAQWFPDWYGNSAWSYISPLFSGAPSFPPNGNNFGFFEDPEVDRLFQSASDAPSADQAAALWARTDHQIMADAALFPVSSPVQPVFHANQVHNAVFVPELFQFDPTNVWLSPSANGD